MPILPTPSSSRPWWPRSSFSKSSSEFVSSTYTYLLSNLIFKTVPKAADTPPQKSSAPSQPPSDSNLRRPPLPSKSPHPPSFLFTPATSTLLPVPQKRWSNPFLLLLLDGPTPVPFRRIFWMHIRSLSLAPIWTPLLPLPSTPTVLPMFPIRSAIPHSPKSLFWILTFARMRPTLITECLLPLHLLFLIIGATSRPIPHLSAPLFSPP